MGIEWWFGDRRVVGKQRVIVGRIGWPSLSWLCRPPPLYLVGIVVLVA